MVTDCEFCKNTEKITKSNHVDCEFQMFDILKKYLKSKNLIQFNTIFFFLIIMNYFR